MHHQILSHGLGPRRGRPKATARDVLSFAAAPTFAIMALLTGVLGSGAPDLLCSAALPLHGSPLTGMVAMYLLMSLFHCGPWLALISRH